MRGISAGRVHHRVDLSASRAGWQDRGPQPLRSLSGALAVYGPNVLVAVADVEDPTVVVWKPLKDDDGLSGRDRRGLD